MADNIPKAVVSESNGEISCSVEETNRIRALLGLKPLRGVPSSSGSSSSGSGGAGPAGGEVKATVSESNGEISCSVEETNRIRALLGLKPLNVDGQSGSSSSVLSQEARSVENFHKQKEEEQKAKEEKELRERLEDAKARRYIQTKFEGRGLGEVGGDEEETKLLSAAEWASRSRAKEISDKEKKRREAEEAARRLDEEEKLLLAGGGKRPSYTSSDLRGLQVQHSAEEFDVGETVILTLADTNILQRNEHGKVIGVNEDVDVLENLNMTEEERRKMNEKIKKRAKMPVYSGYDDAEFAEGAAPGSRPSILAHYDKEATLRPKMVLEEGGQIVTSSPSDMAVTSGGVRFDMAELKRLDDTLGSDSKTMSDYLTPAEYASFNKPKKEKKLRKIRKKDKEETSYSELVDAAAQEDASADRGSRSRGTGGGVAAVVAATDSERRDAYNLALHKAQSASDKVYGETAKKYTKPVLEEAGDDDDLQVALAISRAKSIANQQSAKERAGIDAESKDDSNGYGLGKTDIAAIAIKNAIGDEAAAELMQRKMPRATVKAPTNDGIFDIDAEGRTADGTLVFSDTTEFTSRLQARLNERVRDQADTAVRELASRKRAAEEDEALEGMMDVDENAEESEEEEEEDYDEQLGLLQQKPIASKGLAATLALLKSSGDLKTREELAGRTKDVRDIDPSSDEFGVKLEYRDEFGRKLTQKEAFRQLSYRFHGFGPQQKKQEKRLKALAASNKAASSKGSIDAGTMKSLIKAQEATGKAHVTIQVIV